MNRIFGFEPKTALALIGHLGSATEIFSLPEKELEELTGPYFRHRGKICDRAKDEAAEELISLEREGIKFCGWTEGCYPALLKECEDAPVGLYVRSASPLENIWQNGSRIAIVGTRDISSYGREWCGRMVKSLSMTAEKPVIVSGLALGTDIEAHEAALGNGLSTIGVMATGPETVYPWRHRQTAEKMASTPGCALVTDYPPGTPPLAIHFLRRNRIIAGLSGATVLIESRIKGGGMMTCRLAFSYNRDVLALPGRVDDIRSQGCNMLIRQKIAEPVISETDLIESLGMTTCGGKTVPAADMLVQRFRGKASDDCITRLKTVLEHIRRNRGITVEELAEGIGLEYRLCAQAVNMLEMEGFICLDILQRCSINYKNV